MANNRNQNSGNFAQDPQRASEAGRKGGEQSQSGARQGNNDNYERSAQSGRSSNNFADNPKLAAEAGRKGGENSHGGRNNH
jgi:general stress protein YciG